MMMNMGALIAQRIAGLFRFLRISPIIAHFLLLVVTSLAVYLVLMPGYESKLETYSILITVAATVLSAGVMSFMGEEE